MKRFGISFLLASLACAPAALAVENETIGNWASPPYWAPDAREKPPTEARDALAPQTALGAPLPFIALPPCRIVDTRGGAPLGGGFLPASTPRDYTLSGQCGIPPTAVAASLNVTVTETAGPGYVSLWPAGGAQPVVSTLNYLANETLANAAVVPLTAGAVSVACMNAGCHLIVDTNGFYAPQNVVNTLNAVTGDVTLAQGTNVTITPSGNTFTIASSPGTHQHDAGDLTAGTLPDGRLSGAYAGALTLSNAANALTAATVDLGTTGQIVRGADKFLHSTSANNTFLGVGAGAFLTTATNSTGVGIQALNQVLGTSENTAVGAFALAYATAGNNSAFGSGALMNATSPGNSAFGVRALFANAGGASNSAFGYHALALNQNGTDNTAVGYSSLAASIAGDANTALGAWTLSASTGSGNTALGSAALLNLATGNANIAVGRWALSGLTSGSGNIAIGESAGSALTSGSGNLYLGSPGAVESSTIRIGSTQTTAYLAGAWGATSASGTAVYVNSSGQLGTVVSSRRYKQEVTDVANASDVLMRLRPVAFRYTPDRDPSSEQQYGLIAEEVAEVAPDLVVAGADGQPETVKYHLVNALLLNEVQKQRFELERQQQQIRAQQEEIAALKAELREAVQGLERRLRANR